MLIYVLKKKGMCDYMEKCKEKSTIQLEQCRTNDALIPHYKIQRVEFGLLRKEIKIEESHLKEKNTWFYIDGKLMFFKARQDYRLFTELFCSIYGKILGLNIVDYFAAYVTDNSVERGERPTKRLGLLSPNFQVKDKHYYMFSDLFDTNISNLKHFGEYSLTNLLHYFANQCPEYYYNNIKQKLIDLYIFDYFCDQVDRNPKNLSCEVHMRNKREKHYDALHAKTVDLELSKIFDNERSLGICLKHGKTSLDNTTMWSEKFPYKPDLKGESDGIPNNLWELCVDYPKESMIMLKRIIEDKEYRKVLEQFMGTNKPINIGEKTTSEIEHGFQERQLVLQRVKSLIS